MKKNHLRYSLIGSLWLLCLLLIQSVRAEDGSAPVAADETLIHVIRTKRLVGAAVGFWIAVNDQTVARLKNKKHAIVRAKAGRITVNLAVQGVPGAAIALDDRPGEVVYIKYRLGDANFTEIDEAEARGLLKKTKLMDPIDEILPNNEEVKVLMNLSKMGFELMRPSNERLEPDNESAVVTLFRRREKVEAEFGLWLSDRFIGTLGDSQGLQLRLPPGRHFFAAAQTNTAVVRAELEAGKRYHAWLDIGKMMGTLRVTPVTQDQSKDLDKWLTGVEWLELDPDAMTARVKEREEIVVRHMQTVAERVATGEQDYSVMSAEHSY